MLMSSTIAAGSAIVLAAGALQGTYAVPMKSAKGWNYENIWLVFTAIALVIFPWVLTAATIPHLDSIYRSTPTPTLIAIVGFGLCWGIGVTLTGLGLNMLGIGLAFAVILGISASVGSLIPLLILEPRKIETYQGHVYLIGTVIMLIGIACAARSGYLRDKGSGSILAGNIVPPKGSFLAGLAVVTVAGILSSSLNFCYAFGGPAMKAAMNYGASSVWSSNIITAPATTGGFVANLVYCMYLLRRNDTAKLFRAPGVQWNWLWGVTMAIFWFGGQALYGFGFSHMGELGAVLSWPLLMGMIIITSTAAGYLTGEWKGSSAQIRGYLASSIVLILVALSILALGRGI